MAAVAKGLDGLVVATTAISRVDGANGRLIFRGYEIGELAGNISYEEVCHLLWEGHLPTRRELETLDKKLRAQRALPEAAMAGLRALPHTTDPMDALRTGASAIGAALPIMGTPSVEQAIALTACFPTIVAAFQRLRSGRDPLEPRADLGHAANYLYMLTGEVPEERRVRSLDAYLVMLADHGMNASTFTARVIASTASDLASAVVGGIGALKGPLHGGAPALVLAMLDEIGSEENIEPWIDRALANHAKIMGMGHRVYKTTDPRAEILREMARQSSDPAFFALAEHTERYALAALRRAKPDQPIYTNVEYYSASVLHSVGLPRDLFPPTFAISRVAGWTAHVLEQVAENRLIRPESDYSGPTGLKFVPVDRR